jgi:aminopeptidase N
MVLGTINETLSDDESLFMLKNSPFYIDKAKAMNSLKTNSSPEVIEVLFATLEDEYWATRRKALQSIQAKTITDTSLLKNKLIWLTQKDEKSSVRAEAITALAEKFSSDKNVQAVIEGAMKDQSYLVLGAALRGVAKYDQPMALAKAKKIEADASGSLISAIATLYSQHGGTEEMAFFSRAYDQISDPNNKYVYVQIFGKYLLNQDVSTQAKGLDMLEDISLNEGAWWMRLSAIQVLMGLRQSAEVVDSPEAKSLTERIGMIVEKVKASESNAMIIGMLGN